MKIEELLYKYKLQAISFLLGVIIFCFGLASYNYRTSDNTLNVSEASSEVIESKIIVEISGAVKNPGVYELSSTARIDDLIKIAGGFSGENKGWVSKVINRAAVLKDGQKIYIPTEDEQTEIGSANNFDGSTNGSGGVLSSSSDLVNINTASQTNLEDLPGIGPIYAKKIIDQRPYSDISELKSKDVISESLFEKIKNHISVY